MNKTKIVQLAADFAIEDEKKNRELEQTSERVNNEFTEQITIIRSNDDTNKRTK